MSKQVSWLPIAAEPKPEQHERVAIDPKSTPSDKEGFVNSPKEDDLTSKFGKSGK